MTFESVTFRHDFPFAGVEDVTAVKGNGERFVEEILAGTDFYAPVRFSVSLCDDLLGAVVSCYLESHVIRQDDGSH